MVSNSRSMISTGLCFNNIFNYSLIKVFVKKEIVKNIWSVIKDEPVPSVHNHKTIHMCPYIYWVWHRTPTINLQ